MTATPPSGEIIRVVSEEERLSALWQVFQWEPEEHRRQRIGRYFRLAQQRPQLFDHLLEFVRGGQRRGVAWMEVAPGRVANVWPPSLHAAEPIESADRLQFELERHIRAEGIQYAQSLLPKEATAATACLLRHGYRLAAELAFLVCSSEQFPTAPPSSVLTFEPYRPTERQRLAQLIEATYVDTRDAPALNDVRPIEDVIDGYEHVGTFAPDQWMFVRHQDVDVGCLLLADHPLVNQMELVYMGIVPEQRGQKWGEQVARHALWIARCAGRELMWLGVDAANDPAVTSYTRCGFCEVDRRQVFFKQFPAAAS